MHSLIVKITNVPIGSRWIQNADKVPDIPLGENVRAKIQQFSLMNKFKKKVISVSYSTSSIDGLDFEVKLHEFLHFISDQFSW